MRERCLEADPDLLERMELAQQSSFTTLVPRPDDPANLDQQQSFCHQRSRI